MSIREGALFLSLFFHCFHYLSHCIAFQFFLIFADFPKIATFVMEKVSMGFNRQPSQPRGPDGFLSPKIGEIWGSLGTVIPKIGGGSAIFFKKMQKNFAD